MAHTPSTAPTPGRAIALDTETTGFTPKQGHRIVELAATELVAGSPTGATFHSYLDPCMPVPAMAARVHGLTSEFLRGKPAFADVVDEFLAFLGPPDTPIWAHNAAFDKRFVAAELAGAGHALEHAFCCSLALARRLPLGVDDLKLETLAAHIGYSWATGGAHSALADTRALAAVLADLLWPLEAETARTQPAAKAPPRPSSAPTRGEEATPAYVLPDGFAPLTRASDTRIRRYGDLPLDGRLFGRGRRWSAEEETRLARRFLEENADIDALVSEHGRTPAALIVKLAGMGVVAPGHPYERR